MSNVATGMPVTPKDPPVTAQPSERPVSDRRSTQKEMARRAGEAVLRLGKLGGEFRPPRIVLNAVEGWGKTSCAAFAPEPAVLMAKGETGYQTLLGAGLVPSVQAAYVEDWEALLAFLDDLAGAATMPCKTLALDALGGFERLCHERVCARDFEGKWGEKGFSSYQKGYEQSLPDWLQLLQRLDRVRDRGITILLLGHVQIRPFKNPLGEDFDRYVSDVHHKTWGVTHKWADAVLFGQFVNVVDKDKPTDKKGKGIGGTDRVIYTERRDAYDAKNRYGLPALLDIPNSPQGAWDTIWNAITRKEAADAAA